MLFLVFPWLKQVVILMLYLVVRILLLGSLIQVHLISFSHMFTNYSPCPGNEKIEITDGSFSPIAGKDLIKISESIDLNFFLHVPILACNLLPVSKLSKDFNCRVIFFASHCEF